MSDVWPRAWRPARHTELDSTQVRAMEAARSGAADRLVILADSQTAGRGSRGRCWQAPAGNLNFSALLRPGVTGMPQSAWALLAGVALYDALAPLVPAPNALMLKWPNDVLLNGAKLAGILIDSAVSDSGVLDWVVIGIGVNIQAAPALADRATICLADAGIAARPDQIAASLAHRLDDWMAADMARIRAAWLARAHPVGTPLAVQTPATRIEGAFAGLSPEGGLLLAGRHAPISAGDIHVVQRQPVPGVSSPCFSL